MASYFEEHNCREMNNGETPDHALHLARILIDSGMAVDLDMEFGRLFGREAGRPPPASKDFVNNLPDAEFITGGNDKCAICLDIMKIKDESLDVKKVVKILPCNHCFHSSCITPWLQHVSSCPLCKHDFPTDDKDYEEFKLQKKRAKDRKHMIDELHNSMFA
jgi:hypothetical protein